MPGETLRKSVVVSNTETYTPNESLKKSGDGNEFVVDIAKAERIAKIKGELQRRGFRA